MKHILNLSKTELGTVYIVTKIDLPPNRCARLSSVGLTVGTEIRKLFVSPFGNPTAYEFKGSLFALGNQDAEKIFVEMKNVSLFCQKDIHHS